MKLIATELWNIFRYQIWEEMSLLKIPFSVIIFKFSLICKKNISVFHSYAVNMKNIVEK